MQVPLSHNIHLPGIIPLYGPECESRESLLKIAQSLKLEVAPTDDMFKILHNIRQHVAQPAVDAVHRFDMLINGTCDKLGSVASGRPWYVKNTANLLHISDKREARFLEAIVKDRLDEYALWRRDAAVNPPQWFADFVAKLGER